MTHSVGRVGSGVPEAIVALLLTGLLVSMAWSILARQRQVGADLARRAEGLETVRTLAWVLREEVSVGRPGVDWQIDGGDSLSLRAFRGIGLIESRARGGQMMTVCFRGIRSPSPAKDSLLLLGGDGRWTVVDLEHRDRTSSECSELAGWRRERWTVSQGSTDAVLARLFERGSYHLSGGALRYRRGRGGRQPLTPEVIGTGSFVARGTSGHRFGWEITLRPKGGRSGAAPAGPGSPLPWRGTGW